MERDLVDPVVDLEFPGVEKHLRYLELITFAFVIESEVLGEEENEIGDLSPQPKHSEDYHGKRVDRTAVDVDSRVKYRTRQLQSQKSLAHGVELFDAFADLIK